jgi:cytochrome P450
VDGAAEFAYPYAAEALCIAFNLPDEHWYRFRTWATQIVQAFNTADVMLLQDAVASILEFVRLEMEARRRDPGDDLMTALLNHRVDGRPLTEQEIHGYFVLLVSAGQNTASDSLGHAINHLARHPDHLARLRAEPHLVTNAVEEIIRFYPPLLALARNAAQDVEVGGRTIRKGDQIALVWGSAAHDEEQYADADEFILDRPPTRGVSFGLGMHYCVGADLGRVQVKLAIEEMLAAWPEFHVSGEPVRTVWPTNGFRSLPITIGPAVESNGAPAARTQQAAV